MLSVCTGVQASGLVPIVEPEVLLDGEHDIDATLEVAQAIWAETFKYLADNNVRNLLHPASRWAHVHPFKVYCSSVYRAAQGAWHDAQLQS